MTAPLPIDDTTQKAPDSTAQGPDAVIVDVDADAEALRRRLEEWRPGYRLETEALRRQFEEMVLASLRLDRLREQEATLRRSERLRAAISWDDDRRDEVIELAAGLSRRPELVSRRLQGTKQGAEWMLDRWRRLGSLLERKGAWGKRQASLSLDLLGIPRELRDDEPIDEPAAVVAAEIARLERRLGESLVTLDDLQRRAAERGTPIAVSKTMRDLRREEAACHRDYQRAAKALEKLRVAVPTPPPPAPASAPQPADPAHAPEADRIPRETDQERDDQPSGTPAAPETAGDAGPRVIPAPEASGRAGRADIVAYIDHWTMPE